MGAKYAIDVLGPNVTKVYVPYRVLLFSYNTLVGVFDGERWFVTSKKYSKTTSKHINQWATEHPSYPNAVVDPSELEDIAGGEGGVPSQLVTPVVKQGAA